MPIAWLLSFKPILNWRLPLCLQAAAPGAASNVGNGLVTSWAGARHIVTRTAAMALPTGFRQRDLIVFLAFGVALGCKNSRSSFGSARPACTTTTRSVARSGAEKRLSGRVGEPPGVDDTFRDDEFMASSRGSTGSILHPARTLADCDRKAIHDLS